MPANPIVASGARRQATHRELNNATLVRTTPPDRDDEATWVIPPRSPRCSGSSTRRRRSTSQPGPDPRPPGGVRALTAAGAGATTPVELGAAVGDQGGDDPVERGASVVRGARLRGGVHAHRKGVGGAGQRVLAQ